MTTGEVRKVSTKDLQLVQNLIERCLQLYMSQKEVVNTLQQQAKIEPSFTELVWQKLEEENQEFFRAYHVRLGVKQQIIKFNELLQKQVELMHQKSSTGVASIPMSNGSHAQLIHQTSACLATEHTEHAMNSDNLHPSFGPCIQTAIDMSAQGRGINVSRNMLAQNSNMGMMQETNGELIKSEAGYANNSLFIYGTNGNAPERRPTIGHMPISSFNGVESNETILDENTSSFGFLGQIPRNFSLSDLTADFSISSDILGSYSRSPYLETDNDVFLNPHPRGEHQGDGKSLGSITEGMSYEGFGSD